MSSVLRGRLVQRGLLTFALVATAAAAIAARPFAPGVTYRMRMVMIPPEIPGMPPQPQTVIVGRGATIGTQSRFEVDSVTGQFPLAVGDYMLQLDSGRSVTVSPASKTYSEEPPGLAAMPADLLASATFTNVNVTTEKLGAGETMQGFATEKVRMTVTYSLNMMGTALNTMSVIEMWMAQLPGTVTTAFDGTIPKSMAEGPMKELADKTNAARKALGTATPIKTVTTSSITGPMNITTVNTLELLDIKVGDVDPAQLRIPEGFTKKP
ncbi:MAG TPA: hypothetical protein VFO55_13460 [Gemmatimonadaceae bacterium]|nr:hypothetical protein [Gemmatimonadaceae bacterium]